MAEILANLDEVKAHEKEARSLLTKQGDKTVKTVKPVKVLKALKASTA
jgi:hypothetical protein